MTEAGHDMLPTTTHADYPTRVISPARFTRTRTGASALVEGNRVPGSQFDDDAFVGP
jgi:hypothetical protein